MEKVYQRIDFVNGSVPALNETNLNAISKGLDDLDNRVVQLAGDVLEKAHDIMELSENPPYIGQNGNWYVWSTAATPPGYVDSGIDASITVEIADVTAIGPNDQPYITNTGTNTDPVFHLFIPRGQTGVTPNITATASVDSNVGTPSVNITQGGTAENPTLNFAFSNMKGEPGATGQAAGFGEPSASTDGDVGTPEVRVAAYGPDTQKVFHFSFSKIKGDKGNGITSIVKTGTVGLVDTYTITFTDGTTTTFEVTNGQGMQNVALSNLVDVALSSPGDKQTLEYNSASRKWENVAEKMRVNGGNAAPLVQFLNSALSVGMGAMAPNGTNSVRIGDSAAIGDFSFAQGDSGNVVDTATATTTANVSVGGTDVYVDNIDEKYIGRVCYFSGGVYRGIVESKTHIVLFNGASMAISANTRLSLSLRRCATASGKNSFAHGSAASACGANSHAEGHETIASGEKSHAEGGGSTASGAASHAEGCETIASAPYSHAEGRESVASNLYSHAEGLCTKTGAMYQHAQGKFNVGRVTTLLEVGNGTSENNRRNAFEVYSDGSLSTDNGATKVKLEELPSKDGADEYTFHIVNTAAGSAVAWCNKVAMFIANELAEAGEAFTFSIMVRVGDTLSSLAFDNASAITSITLYDAATAKQTIANTSYTYTERISSENNIVFEFTVAASFVTATVATALNAVIASKSPGFACVYAANTLNLTGTIRGTGVVEQIPGLPFAFNALPSFDHKTQHVGDFYLPTGGPRWYVDVEVDPGTAYMAVCYLENTTTGAYFNHSICYTGVPSVTIAAPTVAPAPVAGKVISFVGTTHTPLIAGVAGVVTNGVVTTKPRLRIVGYHANNAPTAGTGMHLRLFRIY